MRVIGLDVHRSFAVAAAVEDATVRQLGRIELTREKVLAFARQHLRSEDEVVLEATGNTFAIAKLLTPLVKRVVIANPLLVRAIAHAKVKTDKIDAAVLAKLHAAGFLPQVWQRGHRAVAAAGGPALRHRAADDAAQEPRPQHAARQPDSGPGRQAVQRTRASLARRAGPGAG
jgi:hypothetical protein